MTSMTQRIAPAAAAVLLAAAACDNAGSGLTPNLPGTGALAVQVFLDRDGSLGLNGADTVFVGAKVDLRPATGGTVARTLVTLNNGMATATDLNVGDYLISVDPASIGDSIGVGGIDNPQVKVKANGITQTVQIRLSYPTMSIRQARQLPLGKRVMIRGIVLAGVQSFRDTTSHVQDTSLAIRLTRVSIRGGGTGNAPGDTVTVLGTVSSRGGQPTLDQAVITPFANRPAPVPLSVTSSVAGAAQGGVLDASLVLVSNVVITQSAPQAPDYRVVASDGSGPITIIFDATNPVNPATVALAKTISVRGVLVPSGAGTWQLKPRGGGDLTVVSP